MIQINTAQKEDTLGICSLLSQLFKQEADFQAEPHKQEIAVSELIASPDKGHFLVMKQEDKVIACVSLLYLISTAEGGKVALLEDMIVAEAFRQQGLGSVLLREAISFAKEQGCLRITLLTDLNNHLAQNFYQKAGFTWSNMRPMRLNF